MLTFGTLGAAKIAPGALIAPVKENDNVTIHCVAARDRARAESFAKEHGIPMVYDNYDAVIEDETINCLYNPLPISAHKKWTIKALRAGKHVLCEKSFALNATEAQEMADVGKETGLVLMDAFHYRYHPIFLRAREIYSSGDLGDVHTINAAFHVGGPIPETDIRMIYETGGGVTMDIGCYPISWVRHITAEEPVEVIAQAETGPENVDTWLEATMKFESGATATTSGDMRAGAKFTAVLRVEGSKGTMVVNNPLVPQMGNSIELTIDGNTTTEEFPRRPTYSYQLDAFVDAVTNGTTPLTNADDAVQQMALIDRCYEAAGLPRRGTSI